MPTIATGASVAACVLRWMTALAVLALSIAYVCWLVGSVESQDFAKRIWAPVVWLIRNPPDATLVTLLAILVAVVMFFEPMHDFISNLEEVLGAKRKAEPSKRESTSSNPPGEAGDAE